MLEQRRQHPNSTGFDRIQVLVTKSRRLKSTWAWAWRYSDGLQWTSRLQHGAMNGLNLLNAPPSLPQIKNPGIG
jgi:hypothetical protein